MSTDLDRIKAEMSFYKEVGPLEEELEEARAVKADDPVRFADAKAAFEEKRRYYREIAEYLRPESDESDGSDTSITAKTVSNSAKAVQVGGKK